MKNLFGNRLEKSGDRESVVEDSVFPGQKVKMLRYLAMGIVLGLSAGLAPGPLLTLVIVETLRHDIKSGVKVALSPMITDLPIIALTLVVLSKLSHFHHILGVISLIGGAFILYMGYESFRTRNVHIGVCGGEPRSLMKGVLANVLNPHPYLFWIAVGGPTMTRAMTLSGGAAAAFLIGFYAFLVGSKIGLAVLVGKSKTVLSGNVYITTLRFLGLVLVVLAVLIFRDGLELLGSGPEQINIGYPE